MSQYRVSDVIAVRQATLAEPFRLRRYVDLTNGNDSHTGENPVDSGGGDGPFRTLGRGLSEPSLDILVVVGGAGGARVRTQEDPLIVEGATGLELYFEDGAALGNVGPGWQSTVANMAITSFTLLQSSPGDPLGPDFGLLPLMEIALNQPHGYTLGTADRGKLVLLSDVLEYEGNAGASTTYQHSNLMNGFARIHEVIDANTLQVNPCEIETNPPGSSRAPFSTAAQGVCIPVSLTFANCSNIIISGLTIDSAVSTTAAAMGFTACTTAASGRPALPFNFDSNNILVTNTLIEYGCVGLHGYNYPSYRAFGSGIRFLDIVAAKVQAWIAEAPSSIYVVGLQGQVITNCEFSRYGTDATGTTQVPPIQIRAIGPEGMGIYECDFASGSSLSNQFDDRGYGWPEGGLVDFKSSGGRSSVFARRNYYGSPTYGGTPNMRRTWQLDANDRIRDLDPLPARGYQNAISTEVLGFTGTPEWAHGREIDVLAGVLTTGTFQDDSVYVELTSPYNGTTYPRGTQGFPASSISDGVGVAVNNELSRVRVGPGLHTLSVSFTDGAIEQRVSNNRASQLDLVDATIDLSNTEIRSMSLVTADYTAAGTSPVSFEDCVISSGNTITVQNAIFERSNVQSSSNLKPSGGAFLEMRDIVGNTAAATLFLNMVDLTGGFTFIRDVFVNVNYSNLTVNGINTVFMNGGTLTIEASVTSGRFNIFGVGTLVNNSALAEDPVAGPIINKMVDNQELLAAVLDVQDETVGRERIFIADALPGTQWQEIKYESDDALTESRRYDLFDQDGAAITNANNPLVDATRIIAERTPV